MNKKIIGIFVCILFIGASVTPVLSGYVEKINIENKSFLNNPPEEEWNRTYGGPYDDWGSSVEQTKDGGYIIVGGTRSYGPGNNDVWLIRTDSNGNELWNRTYGCSGADDAGFSLQQTTDGGYIITGYTQCSGWGYEVLLIKTDSNGNETWTKTYGNKALGLSVQQTNDEGYIITGYSYADYINQNQVFLIKTNSTGNMEWQNMYGGIGNDYGRSLDQTSDGGYIITGETESYGQGKKDLWLIKTNSTGAEQWSRTFGDSSDDVGLSVKQTIDEGYILVGYSGSFGPGFLDVWLIKTDSFGNENWSRTFGGDSADESGQSVIQTDENGYIIIGWTKSYGAGDYDVWLIKTSEDGNMRWSRTFGGEDRDIGHSVQVTSDGGYIISGETSSYGSGNLDAWLIKVECENQPPSAPTIDGPTNGKPGQTLTFTFNTIDPDDDDVRFHINWGDGNEDWTPYVPSGKYEEMSHAWEDTGTFVITASAEDIFGNIGPEATFTVVIPRNKAINNPILNWLQCHPNLFPILQKLIQQLGFGL
jgi:hypothetical protein